MIKIFACLAVSIFELWIHRTGAPVAFKTWCGHDYRVGIICPPPPGWDRVRVAAKTWCGHVPTSTCPQARLTTYTSEYSIVFQSFFFTAWFFFIQLAFDEAGLLEQSCVSFWQILKRVFDNERMEEKTNTFSKKIGFNIKSIERSLRIILPSLNIPALSN